ARDEADLAPASIASLLAQDYPGSFSVILVDDNSRDGTAEAVAAAARSRPAGLMILAAGAAAPGGAGQPWALSKVVAHVDRQPDPPKYLLFTDADIVHSPLALRTLVARAEGSGLVLSSRMARLRCTSLAERALVPAFVFFFQMLYPFAWVN